MTSSRRLRVCLIKGLQRTCEKQCACTKQGNLSTTTLRIMSFLGIKANKQIFKIPPDLKAY